jgi:hypothetical protein
MIFDKCVIRRTINEFHTTDSEEALWKIIRDLGFRWRKSENNRKVLIEKDDIRAARFALGKYNKTLQK